MKRIASPAVVGAIGVDTIANLLGRTETLPRLAAHRRPTIDFVTRYLAGRGSPYSVTSDEIDAVLSAGFAMQFVTLGGWRSAPIGAVDYAVQIGIPRGASIFLDLEAEEKMDPRDIIREVDRWASAVNAAGYDAGLYHGPGAVLTSAELYARPRVDRYWSSAARTIDRTGAHAEPSCGYCMRQLFPEEDLLGLGILFDMDVVQSDYRNRVPWWVTAT